MIFQQKQFRLSKLHVLTQNLLIVLRNIVWQFEFDRMIFLYHKGIKNLKYTKISVNSAHIFKNTFKM